MMIVMMKKWTNMVTQKVSDVFIVQYWYFTPFYNGMFNIFYIWIILLLQRLLDIEKNYNVMATHNLLESISVFVWFGGSTQVLK